MAIEWHRVTGEDAYWAETPDGRYAQIWFGTQWNWQENPGRMRTWFPGWRWYIRDTRELLSQTLANGSAVDENAARKAVCGFLRTTDAKRGDE